MRCNPAETYPRAVLQDNPSPTELQSLLEIEEISTNEKPVVIGDRKQIDCT
jgi:hypothetical protein